MWIVPRESYKTAVITFLAYFTVFVFFGAGIVCRKPGLDVALSEVCEMLDPYSTNMKGKNRQFANKKRLNRPHYCGYSLLWANAATIIPIVFSHIYETVKPLRGGMYRTMLPFKSKCFIPPGNSIFPTFKINRNSLLWPIVNV